MSPSEISASSPLPVTVTNFTSSPAAAFLPEEFKEGTKWDLVSLTGGPTLFFTIERVEQTWLYGDFSDPTITKGVWLNVSTFVGFAWKLSV